MTKEQRLRYEYYKYYRPDFPTDKRTREVVDMALSIKEETDAIYRAMDKYAKQQAIAFAIDYAKGVLTWGNKKPEEVENDRMDVRYNHFIEQQNNKNDTRT